MMKKKLLLIQLMLTMAVLAISACHTDLIMEESEQPVIEDEVTQQGATIWAGFDCPSTKTGLSIDDVGSNAQVVWKRGDSFNLYPFTSKSDWLSSITFTTESDNVSSAEFTSPSSLPAAAFYGAVYPSEGSSPTNVSFLFGSYSKLAFITTIPSSQVAVPGSFDPSANPTVAYASTNEEVQHLHFKNVVSLLKVRVRGEGVKNLSSIRVSCNGAAIAGSSVAIMDFDSEPILSFLDQRLVSTSVVLTPSVSDSFIEDTDYYLAIMPGTYSGISISFFYNDGSSSFRTVNQSVTFDRSKIRNLGTFSLPIDGDPSVVKYMSSRKTKPVNLCVLSEGFTSDQRDSFETLAKSGIDFLFSVDPYKSLADYFNVYLMWAPSEDEGASVTDGRGNIITSKNTAFHAKWGTNSYTDMAADDNAIVSFVTSHCPEIVFGKATITEVPILLIINDARYGGKAFLNSNGRSYCLVPFARNGETLYWSFPTTVPDSNDPNDGLFSHTLTNEERSALGHSSGDWRNILLHEFGGHCIARLADEYWSESYASSQGPISGHSYKVPYGLNISGYYDTVPWKELLDKQNDLISMNSLFGRLGKYQGGDRKLFNRWRSEAVSCMTDTRPYFSAWQRILIAKRIVELAGETFSLSAYLPMDNPIDPIRDGTSAPDPITSNRGLVTEMPPLAPPELIDIH